MTSRRVGTRLIAWAERRCDLQTFEAVVLPMIADMQHEQAAYAHRSLLVRWWSRTRGYACFAYALAAAVLLNGGRIRMYSKVFVWLRVGFAVPLALFLSLVTEFAVSLAFGMLFNYAGLGHSTPAIFTIKVLTSPFIGAAFVATMCLVSPRNLRMPVAVGALVVVGLWGGYLVALSVVPLNTRVSGWLLTMG